jgi:hypothetical protein
MRLTPRRTTPRCVTDCKTVQRVACIFSKVPLVPAVYTPRQRGSSTFGRDLGNCDRRRADHRAGALHRLRDRGRRIPNRTPGYVYYPAYYEPLPGPDCYWFRVPAWSAGAGVQRRSAPGYPAIVRGRRVDWALMNERPHRIHPMLSEPSRRSRTPLARW